MCLHRAAAVATLAALTAACGPGGGGDRRGSSPELSGELLVSAAASLTDAFAEVEVAFERAHPAVDVVLNVGGSSALRVQIVEGAPVDVFASADPSNVDRVVEAGLVSGEPHVFARNRLAIAVPAGNPAGVHGLADFARAELRLGLCAEGVPCGDFARRALERAGVAPSLDTDEPDVRALLTKIELGELDAGITYATDVASAGGSVEGIDIPDRHNLVTTYPMVVLASAPNPRAAEAFVRFVLSDGARSVLVKHGFALP